MNNKQCNTCGEWLPLCRFHPKNRKANGRTARCTACRTIYQREYYAKNRAAICERKRIAMARSRRDDPGRHRATYRRYNERRKEKMFSLYGDSCSICGFTDKRALTLDHINNNGADERKRLGESRILTVAITHYQPEQYRILCMNCQFIERSKSGVVNQHPQVVARILNIDTTFLPKE